MEPRPENREVVEIREVDARGKETVIRKIERDDIIGEEIKSNMKLVSRWGIIAKYDNPQDLYIAGLEYFKWATETPIEKKELIKGGAMAGMQGSIDVPRPWSVTAMRRFIGLGVKSYNQYKSGDGYEAFHPVIEFFEDCIHTQKFENAVVGIYNANLVSRDLGLTDKSESKQEINIKAQIIGMRIIED
jgi:hypothetical protein